MTMTRVPRGQPPVPKRLQGVRGQRVSLTTPPDELIGDPEVREAIALHRSTKAKLAQIMVEITAAERAIRRADAVDLRARAAAELRGKKDPGAVETKKTQELLEKLQDRRLVLVQATDDAAVAVLNLVERRRSELLEATATELEPLRHEYLAAIDRLAELHERVTDSQGVRAWYANVPNRAFSRHRAAIVEGLDLGRILAALRAQADVEALEQSAARAKDSRVGLLGEGDERYAEVNA